MRPFVPFRYALSRSETHVCHDARTLQACGAFRNTTMNLSGGTEPERVQARMMSAGVLSMQISPWVPLAWIASTITLLAVSLLASWVPARRALRVDPVVALGA